MPSFGTVYTNPLTPSHVRSNWAALKNALEQDLVDETELEAALEALRWKSAQATENIAAGDVVYLSSAGMITKARADAQRDADGVAVEAITSGTSGFFAYGGFLGGFTGLTPGAVQFLSGVTAGDLVETPDLESVGASIIIVCRAVSTTEVWIDIHPGILL
jgi:hypothetical protein